MKDKNIIRKSLNKKGWRLFIITLIAISFLTVNVFAEYKIVVTAPFLEGVPGEIYYPGKFDDTGYEGPGVKIKVPLYIQTEIKGMFGSATISEAGCGPTSASMVLAALTKRPISVREFAQEYSRFFTPGQGAQHELMTQFAKDNGLKVKQTEDMDEVKRALESGSALVISIQSSGIFTRNGHFIVLKGINGDTVYINDPASKDRSAKGWNLKEQVHVTSDKYWIYTK